MKKKTFKGGIGYLSLSELFSPVRLDMVCGGLSMAVPSKKASKYNSISTDIFATTPKDITLPNTEGMQVPEGLEVKPEDFLYVPFRLISATMVAAGSWRSTYFKPSALKQAVGLLKGKGVFTDHDDRPKNWLGFVADTKWQAQSVQNGKTIPAGINGLLAIDTKQERNKDVARGILAGSVYSNSVGVMFNFEASHEFADEWSFRNRIGTIAEDGRMVHMVVTEIIDFYETSLVSLGADPYAKRIDKDGNLVNVDNGGVFEPQQNGADYSSDVNFLRFHKEKTEKSLKIVWGLDKNVLALSGKQRKSTKTDTTNSSKMNTELEKALLALFSLSSLEDLTPKKVEEFSQAHSSTKQSLEDLNKVTLSLNKGTDLKAIFENHVLVEKTEADKANTEIQTLKTQNESLEKMAKIGSDYVNMQRELAKKFYRLAKMEAASEVVCGLIDKADEKELAALIKEHGISIGGEFSYHCSDCGSSNFKFQSSKESPEDVEKGTKIITLTTNDTIRENLKKQRIFGQP